MWVKLALQQKSHIYNRFSDTGINCSGFWLIFTNLPWSWVGLVQILSDLSSIFLNPTTEEPYHLWLQCHVCTVFFFLCSVVKAQCFPFWSYLHFCYMCFSRTIETALGKTRYKRLCHIFFIYMSISTEESPIAVWGVLRYAHKNLVNWYCPLRTVSRHFWTLGWHFLSNCYLTDSKNIPDYV